MTAVVKEEIGMETDNVTAEVSVVIHGQTCRAIGRHVEELVDFDLGRISLLSSEEHSTNPTFPKKKFWFNSIASNYKR